MIDFPEHPLTALLVIPSLAQGSVLRRLLLGEGFSRVFQAADGREALCVLGAERVDIVFAPWGPGEAPGRMIQSYLHARGAHRRTRIIVLDEGLPRQTIVSAVKAGAAGVLALPALPADVREVLSELATRGETPSGENRHDS